MIRTEITGAEVAEEMEKERRLFQLQMCEVQSWLPPQAARVNHLLHPTLYDWLMIDWLIDSVCLTVSDQSQWDKDEEGRGPAAEPHQVLPCSVQVRAGTQQELYSSMFYFENSLNFLFPGSVFFRTVWKQPTNWSSTSRSWQPTCSM